MARTSKSRGVTPFTMKSGNTPSHNDLSGASPMPFLNKFKNTGVGKFLTKAVNTSPIGLGVNALIGNTSAPTFGNVGEKLMGGGDGEEDTKQMIAEVHAAVTGGNDPNAIGGINSAEAIDPSIDSTIDPMVLAAKKEEKALRRGV